MRKLNESQNEALNVFMPVALFLIVMSFFIATTPNYIQEDKVIQDIPEHTQSKVLDAYGELIIKHTQK
jgi:hypothetical protein